MSKSRSSQVTRGITQVLRDALESGRVALDGRPMFSQSRPVADGSFPVERRLVVLPDDSVVEAVIGYREWRPRVDRGEVLLHSLSHVANVWDARVHDARCLCAAYGPSGHTCGIYAWATKGQLRGRYGALQGEVALWGDVHIHELGYRAEHAMITCFYRSGSSTFITELAAIQYGVPLVGFD